MNAFPEQKQFTALSSDGDAFDVSVDNFKDGVRDQATDGASPAAAQTYADPIVLPDGTSLLWERSGKSWALQQTRPGGGVERISLQAAAGDAISARPAAFGGAILAPLSRGSIWLLDPATGGALGSATPFQPETTPGAKVKWLPPLVVDERQFVAVDAARKTIYLARREEKPTPFLAQTRPLDVDYEPVHAALLGKTLLVVARGLVEDEIVALSIPSLQEIKRLKLAARVGSRGLEVAGDSAFCETNGGELLKISATLDITARAKLADSPLVTAPLALGDDWIVVAQNGKVLRMQENAGELQTVIAAGQPLTGAVQLMGSSLLAGAADGSLHVLPLSGSAN